GYYSMSRNIPPQDTPLLTTLATLAGNENIHPRLIEAILMAAEDLNKEIENNNKMHIFLETQTNFPSEDYLDFPLHNTAEVYFQDGPSFLSRYLSYQFIFFVSRIKFFLIPLIPALVLFIKVAPGAYRLRVLLILKEKYKELNKL